MLFIVAIILLFQSFTILFASHPISAIPLTTRNIHPPHTNIQPVPQPVRSKMVHGCLEFKGNQAYDNDKGRCCFVCANPWETDSIFQKYISTWIEITTPMNYYTVHAFKNNNIPNEVPNVVSHYNCDALTFFQNSTRSTYDVIFLLDCNISYDSLALFCRGLDNALKLDGNLFIYHNGHASEIDSSYFQGDTQNGPDLFNKQFLLRFQYDKQINGYCKRRLKWSRRPQPE